MSIIGKIYFESLILLRLLDIKQISPPSDTYEMDKDWKVAWKSKENVVLFWNSCFDNHKQKSVALHQIFYYLFELCRLIHVNIWDGYFLLFYSKIIFFSSFISMFAKNLLSLIA